MATSSSTASTGHPSVGIPAVELMSSSDEEGETVLAQGSALPRQAHSQPQQSHNVDAPPVEIAIVEVG